MARATVWATQRSWQRLVGFAYTSEEELLKHTPKPHHTSLQGVADVVKQEDDGVGVSLVGYEGTPGTPLHGGVTKMESSSPPDGYQDYGGIGIFKRRKCQHPTCQKQARKSSEGQTMFCKGHMKQHGLSPNVPKCRHVNCGKQAQLSVDGKTLFCKVHMKENGLIPRQRVCAEGDCQKRVKQSLQGPGIFCIAHMKQHGLTPKLRLCQNATCAKQAVPDVEGKRLYCVAHMKEHGMEPYFRLRKCQAPNCDKKATSDAGGKKTFCSFHAKVFEELQNSALANYQGDPDEA